MLKIVKRLLGTVKRDNKLNSILAATIEGGSLFIENKRESQSFIF